MKGANVMDRSNVVIFGRPLFEGITNKLLVDEDGIPGIQIRHAGGLVKVKIARSQEELTQVRLMIAEAVASDQGTGFEELLHISHAGRVLMVESDDGLVAAVGPILTMAIQEHLGLATDEARCWDIVVRPGEEDKDYVQILSKAQEVVAREAGKRRMTLTLRFHDARSISARLRAGFRVVGVVGCEAAPAGAVKPRETRLLMEKSLVDEPVPCDPVIQAEQVKAGLTPRVIRSQVETLLATQPPEIALRAPARNAVNTDTLYLAERVLTAGYVGTGLLAATEYDANGMGESLLIFHRRGAPTFTRGPFLPIRVNSEFGRLREVMVAYPPVSATLTPEQAVNVVARHNVGNVDPIAFTDEYEAFIEALRTEGVLVVRTTAQGKNGSSSVFTRDPALVIDDVFIIGALQNERRAYETAEVRKFGQDLRLLDVASEDQGEPTVLEGGDVTLLDGEHIIVGLGNRTNETGLRKLAASFPMHTFIGVRHGDLHLDVLFTVVGAKKALADTTRLPEDFICWLKDDGFDVIAADPREQNLMGCNVLAIDNNRVIAVAENRNTNQRLRDHDVEVIEVSMPNIIKKGGGPRCLACPTNRDEILSEKPFRSKRVDAV